MVIELFSGFSDGQDVEGEGAGEEPEAIADPVLAVLAALLVAAEVCLADAAAVAVVVA